MSTERIQETYRQMFTIRKVEERLLDLFSEGQLSGTVHTCLGQEACAVGVVGALRRDHDLVVSNHRGHGHFLVHSDWDIHGLLGEIMGRACGVSKGLGGSQQLFTPTFFSTGVQGSLLPTATGMAFAEKLKGSDVIVTAFIGDGTLGEGVLYESLNIAARWSLPVLFVVEANEYAQTTPTSVQHAGLIAERAAPFGIKCTEMDVSDVFEVRSSAAEITSRIRRSSEPEFLLLNTYRLGPHSKGDDFRPPEELESYRQRDPMTLLRDQCVDLDPDGLEHLEREVTRQVEIAVENVTAAPLAAPIKAEAT